MNVGGDKINLGVVEVALFLKPMAWKSTLLRFTLGGGLGSKLLGTNLNSFDANWTHELDLALDPSFHLGTSNHELSFLTIYIFWSKPIDFLSKMVSCRFSLDLPPFGLGPSSKGHGSNSWLSSIKIALFIGPGLWTLI